MPHQFVGKKKPTIIFHWIAFHSFVKNQYTCGSASKFYFFISLSLCPKHNYLITIYHNKHWNHIMLVLQICLLFFSFLTIVGSLHFCVNIRISLSISTTNPMVILIGITLDLYITGENSYPKNIDFFFFRGGRGREREGEL